LRAAGRCHEVNTGVNMLAQETRCLPVCSLPGIHYHPGRTPQKCHQSEKLRTDWEAVFGSNRCRLTVDQAEFTQQSNEITGVTGNP